jgi:hypothetical protein
MVLTCTFAYSLYCKLCSISLKWLQMYKYFFLLRLVCIEEYIGKTKRINAIYLLSTWKNAFKIFHIFHFFINGSHYYLCRYLYGIFRNLYPLSDLFLTSEHYIFYLISCNTIIFATCNVAYLYIIVILYMKKKLIIKNNCNYLQ